MISDFKKDFKCEVIAPGDHEYDAARTVFFGGIDKHPALIVRVQDKDDIKKAIQLAQNKNLEIAVRSGGHSYAGYSTTEGGIVIDLRNLRGLDIDTKEKTAWAQTGLTAGEYTQNSDKLGFVTGFGDTSSVGIGGITLCGGIGFLVRKYGLTIDNLLSAEITTADGRFLKVDRENHPDLFWAIKGGGGNFGVVSRLKFRLHNIDKVTGGILILPATPEVIEGFAKEAEIAQNELSAIMNIMPAPPMPFVPEIYHGKLIIMALMLYVGDLKKADKVFATFRKLSKPIADQIRPMRYPEMFFPDDKSYHPLAVSETMFMKNIDVKISDLIIERLNSSDASMRVVQLRVLGGAYSEIPDDATAFAHRKSKILANIASFYEGPADREKRLSWVKDLSLKLFQGDAGKYCAFMGAEKELEVRKAYPGDTWNRLQEVKKRYDPENIFHLNQNVLL